jgi:hypothetical protein
MSQLNALLLFAVVTLGLGHGVLTVSGAPLQRNVIFKALELESVGLATFSFLGVVFGVLHVPIYWPLYLALACVGPALALRRNLTTRARVATPPAPRADAGGESEAASETERYELAYAVMLVVLLVYFFKTFHAGAYAYPYLEDEDPWMHAQGALYVALEHTARADSTVRPVGNFAFYLEPYPPTFDVLMGVLRQVGDSVSSTLKTFNVVLATLAIGFSFLFGGAYFKSVHKGFFAAVVLAALPSFMSHFIWSQSLALAIFLAALYATVRSVDDKRWVPAAIVTVASMLVTQPVVSFQGAIVLVLLVACLHFNDSSPASGPRDPSRAAGLLRVLAGGVGLSLLFWGSQVAKWGMSGMFAMKGSELTTKWQDAYAVRSVTLSQTLFPEPDMIDQPTGWGIVVAGALCVGLVEYAVRQVTWRDPARRSFTDLHLLAWFAPLCYLVFAPSYGLPSWGSARAWAYMAIPVALLATEGVFRLAEMSIAFDPRLELAVVAAATLGVAATSAPAKVELETNVWQPGQHWFYARSEGGSYPLGLGGFVKMREMLPAGTRVYSFCANGDSHTIGFDMVSNPWNPTEAEFRHRGSNVSAADAIRFLDARNYAHFTFDAGCAKEWGEAEAKRFIDDLGKQPRVRALYTEKGFLLGELREGMML